MSKPYRYTRRRVCRKGRLDGRGWRWKFPLLMKEPFPVQPAKDATKQAAFESELLRAGDDHLTDLATAWSIKDKTLKPRYCEALVHVQETFKGMEFESKEFAEAKKAYDDALEDFEELPSPAWSKSLEWIVIIGLAVGEFFFNYLIFSVLGQSKLDTIIIAVTMSIALPFSALAFGHVIRIERKTIVQRLWAIVLVLVPLIVFASIAFLREALFEAAWSQAELRLNISPGQATIAFVVINLLIWLIAAFVSYRAAHKDPESYRTLKVRLRNARKVMEREGSDYKAAVKAYERARMRYEKAKHLRKEEFDHIVAVAQDLIKMVKWYISVYRTSNQQARKDGSIPPCFHGSIPELSIPVSLQESSLDWDCDLPDRRQHLQSPNPN